jgi:uncharacterized protein YbjQ (UPF0145 family)
MLVVTTENVPGYRVREVKGQVFGVVVRSRGLGGNIMAGLRSIVGGEITEYTQLLEEARRHAVDRLVKNASLMQANAVVMMRFDSAEIGQTMSEIVAYGTAVVLEKAAWVLRTSLLVLSGALALVGIILLHRGQLAAGANVLGIGALIWLGTVFERWRYHPKHPRSGASWEPTGERFEDYQTGKTMRVLYDPGSGERRYVSDSEQPPGGGSHGG